MLLLFRGKKSFHLAYYKFGQTLCINCWESNTRGWLGGTAQKKSNNLHNHAQLTGDSCWRSCYSRSCYQITRSCYSSMRLKEVKVSGLSSNTMSRKLTFQLMGPLCCICHSHRCSWNIQLRTGVCSARRELTNYKKFEKIKNGWEDEKIE